MDNAEYAEGLSIRPARPADCAALERLIGQLGYEAGAKEIRDRLVGMERAGRFVFVGEAGGEVVGCLTTSLMQVLHRPASVGRISMMVVDEARRNRGVGAALVRAAERALAAQACYMVEVTSNLARSAAHRFYERLGYEKTSVRLARMLDPTN